MNKFKVGDRVRAYDSSNCDGLVGVVEGNSGYFRGEECTDYLLVRTDGGRNLTIHYKQCRKLKKKQMHHELIEKIETTRESLSKAYNDLGSLKIEILSDIKQS